MYLLLFLYHDNKDTYIYMQKRELIVFVPLHIWTQLKNYRFILFISEFIFNNFDRVWTIIYYNVLIHG